MQSKFLVISIILIILGMIPFVIAIEKKQMQARELVIISVLCALGIAGRAAFFAVPSVKPIAAIVIIAAICYGARAGFLVGTMTIFVSNFFFGQGSWTPFQMLGFGLIGVITGILNGNTLLSKNRLFLSIYGGLITFIVYGGIVNASYIFTFASTINMQGLMLAYANAVGFDSVHAISTAVFLYIISDTLIRKLERVNAKYGLIHK